MRLGATLVHLSDAPPYAVADWARRLVDAGFESLWTPHIVGRGPLVPDPFVALAVAAGVTTDVELATATVQVPLYHPADLAHRVLSLRAVCGARLTLGVSPGSTDTDYATLERDFGTRFPTFRHEIERLRGLLDDGWDGGAVLDDRHDGTRPALLLGSWGANVERAARDFDGWIASAHRSTPDEILVAHERFRAAGGRRAVVCAIPIASDDDLDRTEAALRCYEDAGVDDAVVVIAPGGPDPAVVRDLLPPH